MTSVWFDMACERIMDGYEYEVRGTCTDATCVTLSLSGWVREGYARYVHSLCVEEAKLGLGVGRLSSPRPLLGSRWDPAWPITLYRRKLETRGPVT